MLTVTDNRQQPTYRRKGKKNRATVGTGESIGLKSVPQSRDYWQFAVYRLENSTTAEQVRRHLHEKGIEVVEVWMLSSKYPGTKTAKIRVAKEQKKRATDKSIWPVGCRVRDWEFSAKKDGGSGSTPAS